MPDLALQRRLPIGAELMDPHHAHVRVWAPRANLVTVVTKGGARTALARDDASKAFSFAADNVREAVGTAPAFIAMVRRDYPVVYRPASVAFLKPELRGDQVIQRVQMLDASGDAWLAIYSLQRQKNKSWRITGCAVVENKGRMA